MKSKFWLATVLIFLPGVIFARYTFDKNETLTPSFYYDQKGGLFIGADYDYKKFFFDWADVNFGIIGSPGSAFYLGLANAQAAYFPVELSWFFYGVSDFKLPISVSRGKNRSNDYYINLNLAGSLLSGKMLIFDEILFVELRSFNTLVKFNDIRDGNSVVYSSGDLFGVNKNWNLYQINSSLSFLNENIRPTSGLKITYNQSFFSNYQYIKEFNISTLNFDLYIPLGGNFIRFSSLRSSSSSSSTSSNNEAIQQDLIENCELENSQECDQQVQVFTEFINAHNTLGTAQPLGGDRMRGDYLWRFMGADSEYYLLEYTSLINKFNNNEYAEGVAYYEFGKTWDRGTSLPQKTITDVGIAYRYRIFSYTIRADLSVNDNSDIRFSFSYGKLFE